MKLVTYHLATSACLLLAAAFCVPAFAQTPHKDANAAHVHYAWASVTRVNPVYRNATLRAPQVPCAQHDSAPGEDADGAPAHGPRAADSGDHNESNHSEAAAPCPQTSVTSHVKQIVGYNVEYRYRGHLYMARLDYDPGERLRVRVSVTPVD